MPNRCTLPQRAQTEKSFTSKHLPRSLRVIKTPLTGGLTAVGCVCVNVCPYPQGRNYIQNADAVQTPHKTQPWWRAWRRIRDPPASNMHEHTSTLRPHRHTLEQRAYLQSANGEVEWETERGREREGRALGQHKVEGGSGVWETERERDKDAPITFVLFIAITVAVIWWNKLSHGGEKLQKRSLEYLSDFSYNVKNDLKTFFFK